MKDEINPTKRNQGQTNVQLITPRCDAFGSILPLRPCQNSIR